jgi:hypothetical protein
MGANGPTRQRSVCGSHSLLAPPASSDSAAGEAGRRPPRAGWLRSGGRVGRLAGRLALAARGHEEPAAREKRAEQRARQQEERSMLYLA